MNGFTSLLFGAAVLLAGVSAEYTRVGTFTNLNHGIGGEVSQLLSRFLLCYFIKLYVIFFFRFSLWMNTPS